MFESDGITPPNLDIDGFEIRIIDGAHRLEAMRKQTKEIKDCIGGIKCRIYENLTDEQFVKVT